MSPQMIELLIFAGVAFFIINKLIAILGSTSDDDPAKRGSSFFGEPALKDVTSTTKHSGSILKKGLLEQSKPQVNSKELKDIVVQDNLSAVLVGLEAVQSQLSSFKLSNFIQSSKLAFKMIIEENNNQKYEELANLIDKRFSEKFRIHAENYGSLLSSSGLDAKVSEIYLFGNNVFIKILFSGQNITTKIKNLNEEWTFTKSLIVNNPNWHLTNIDKV